MPHAIAAIGRLLADFGERVRGAGIFEHIAGDPDMEAVKLEFPAAGGKADGGIEQAAAPLGAAANWSRRGWALGRARGYSIKAEAMRSRREGSRGPKAMAMASRRWPRVTPTPN